MIKIKNKSAAVVRMSKYSAFSALHFLRISFFCLAFLFAFKAVTYADFKPPANLSQGSIFVDNIKGSIFSENPQTKERTYLKEGDILEGAFILETQPSSEATVMFSNGTGIQLFSNTRVSCKGFLQTPHNVQPTEFRSLSADPAASYASLNVERGRILGHAEKLRSESVLFIETPKLIADIRGTIFSFENYEGETRSEVGVYEGSVAIVAKTTVSDADKNVLRTTLDAVSDLSPLETILGTGKTLSVTSNVRDITLVMGNITQNEYNRFIGNANSLATKLGIGPDAMRSAIANAYGGTAQSDNTPSRSTTIQNSTVNTSLGTGFKIVTRTVDQGFTADGSTKNVKDAYDSQETVVGARIKNTDGSITTISKKTTFAISSDNKTTSLSTGYDANGVLLATTNTADGKFQGTIYTANTKEILQTDGSYVTTTSVKSDTYTLIPQSTYTGSINVFDYSKWLKSDGSVDTNYLTGTPLTQTYNSTTTVKADGSATKTASASGTVTFSETVTTTADAKGKLTRTVLRTRNGVTTTYIDPLTNYGALAFISNANDQLILTSSGAKDKNGKDLGSSVFTSRFADGTKTSTLAKTSSAGTLTTETETLTLGAGSDPFRLTNEFKSPPTTGPSKTTTTIKRLANGGYELTRITTNANGTSTQYVEKKVVRDNGNYDLTKTITSYSATGVQTAYDPASSVSKVNNADGSQTITTIVNANKDSTLGNTGDTYTQFTIRDGTTISSSSGILTGTGTDADIIAGIDNAIKNLTNNPVVSR